MLSRIKIVSTGSLATGLSFFSQALAQVAVNNMGEPSPRRGRKSPTKFNKTKEKNDTQPKTNITPG